MLMSVSSWRRVRRHERGVKGSVRGEGGWRVEGNCGERMAKTGAWRRE
jgi:hypothetical protein